MARGARDGVEDGEAGDHRDHEGDHDDGLVVEPLDDPRGREDYDPLDEAEGDVEEGGQVCGFFDSRISLRFYSLQNCEVAQEEASV